MKPSIKQVLFIVMCLIMKVQLNAQTLDVQYLNPKFIGSSYDYIRFGNASNFYGGFMYNKNSQSYGNGNDFTIFTYYNYDMFLKSFSGNIYLNQTSAEGNVGIGTTLTRGRLDLGTSLGIGEGFRLGDYVSINEMENYGNQGYIGFNVQLETNGSLASGTTLQQANSFKPIWKGNGTTHGTGLIMKMAGSGLADIDFLGINWNSQDNMRHVNEFTRIMRLNADGKVGIGKIPSSTSDYLLDVNGAVRANEIVVNTTGADFVFADDYRLHSLDSVQNFINKNKHLPDVPSAKEMQENGMGVAKMNQLLLQKVEELTLYMIELKKITELQQLEIEVLKTK